MYEERSTRAFIVMKHRFSYAGSFVMAACGCVFMCVVQNEYVPASYNTGPKLNYIEQTQLCFERVYFSGRGHVLIGSCKN